MLTVPLGLEADRDVHQALLAEKAAMAAVEETEMQAARQASQENMGQARQRVGDAVAMIDDADVKTFGEEFTAKFDLWVEKTNKVIDYAATENKMVFARRISNGGSGETAFNDMRDVLDRFTEHLGVLTNQRSQTMEQRKQAAVQTAEQVASASQTLAQGTSEQAAGIEETTSSGSWAAPWQAARHPSGPTRRTSRPMPPGRPLTASERAQPTRRRPPHPDSRN